MTQFKFTPPPLPEPELPSGYSDWQMRAHGELGARLAFESRNSKPAFDQAILEAQKDGVTMSALERLRLFCSLAMSGADWIHCAPLFAELEVQDRAPCIEPTIDPNPPALKIQWHDSVETIHRAMWEDVAIESGSTYEDLLEGDLVADTEQGETISLSVKEEIDALRAQKCWGFIQVPAGIIHAWADRDADPVRILHMLAHEIGHATGAAHPDDLQEEMRAEQFGRVAAMAMGFLSQRQGANLMAQTHRADQDEAKQVCAQAYQVVGSLLDDLGTFTTPYAKKILDNLSTARLIHSDVLPWPSFDKLGWLADEPSPLDSNTIQTAISAALRTLKLDCSDPLDFDRDVAFITQEVYKTLDKNHEPKQT